MKRLEIDVEQVIAALPAYERFRSVRELHDLVETLRTDAAFQVEVVGQSAGGLPIHHVRFGRGSVRVLVVAFPHCCEPIGSLTVDALLTLMRQRHPELCEADVEWHIVPCIDPDGALLNEGWTQQPFTFENRLKHFHLQPLAGQVDGSFPIDYKRLKYDRPTVEALALRSVLDSVRPRFYLTLHDARIVRGAWAFLTRNVDTECQARIHEILRRQAIPLNEEPGLALGFSAHYGPGVYEAYRLPNHYDHLERLVPDPAAFLQCGATSWDYLLMQLESQALAFTLELSCVKYCGDTLASSGRILREIKLEIDASNKFLLVAMLEEWERVREDVDTTTPFYRKTMSDFVPLRNTLADGIAFVGSVTQDLLFNPAYGRVATEGERVTEYLERYSLLCQSYEFVRMLAASPQTPAVMAARDRLERMFDEALADVDRAIDFSAFEVIDCGTLARVQLGSGLIVLNSVLSSSSSL